eukprot:g5177.t1
MSKRVNPKYGALSSSNSPTLIPVRVSPAVPASPNVSVETYRPHLGSMRSHLDSEYLEDCDPLSLDDEKLLERSSFAVHASLIANLILFSFKLFASVTTMSLAIIASTVDSALDLVSQLVVFWAQRGTSAFSKEEYPVGRNKLEPLGVILCASLMGSASLLVIFESIQQLAICLASKTRPATLNVHSYDILIMVVAVVVKAVLYFYCNTLRHLSPSALALAEDHRNDVFSNAMAISTAAVAMHLKWAWWVDEAGAILICVYIIYSWIEVASEHVEMIVGKSASSEFVTKVSKIANSHHDLLELDIIRAYHFGTKFLVELEVVMPRGTILEKTHDGKFREFTFFFPHSLKTKILTFKILSFSVALLLQKKVESLPQVERAFVHVDYERRKEDEHAGASKR